MTTRKQYMSAKISDGYLKNLRGIKATLITIFISGRDVLSWLFCKDLWSHLDNSYVGDSAWLINLFFYRLLFGLLSSQNKFEEDNSSCAHFFEVTNTRVFLLSDLWCCNGLSFNYLWVNASKKWMACLEAKRRSPSTSHTLTAALTANRTSAFVLIKIT